MIFIESAVLLASPLLSLIAPSVVFFTGQSVINTALEGAGLYKAPIITILIGASAKLIASWILISKLPIGVVGAPVGTVLSYAFGFFASLVILKMKTDLTVPLFRELIPPLISATLAFFVTEFIANITKLMLEGVFRALLIVILFSLFYLLFYAFLLTVKHFWQIYPSNCTKKELKN